MRLLKEKKRVEMKRNFGAIYDNPTVDYWTHNWVTEQQVRALIATLPGGAPGVIATIQANSRGGFEVLAGTGPAVTVGLTAGTILNQFLMWNGTAWTYVVFDPAALVTATLDMGVQINPTNEVALVSGVLDNDVMVWDGNSWAPNVVPATGGAIQEVDAGPEGGITIGSGTGPAVTVKLTDGTPATTQGMVWNSGTMMWSPAAFPGAAYAVTSVTAAVVNPGVTVSPTTGAVSIVNQMGPVTMTSATRGDVLFKDLNVTPVWVNRPSRDLFSKQKKLSLMTKWGSYATAYNNLNCSTNGIYDSVFNRNDNGLTPLLFDYKGVDATYVTLTNDPLDVGSEYGDPQQAPAGGIVLDVVSGVQTPGRLDLGSNLVTPVVIGAYSVSLHLTGYVHITNQHSTQSATTNNFIFVIAHTDPLWLGIGIGASGTNYTTNPFQLLSTTSGFDGLTAWRGPSCVLTGAGARGTCKIDVQLGLIFEKYIFPLFPL